MSKVMEKGQKSLKSAPIGFYLDGRKMDKQMDGGRTNGWTDRLKKLFEMRGDVRKVLKIQT